MTTPATLTESTLAKEILDELRSAMALPADGVVYVQGQVRYTHRPATRLKCQQVLVSKYGVTFRRVLRGRSWGDVEQIAEQI